MTWFHRSILRKGNWVIMKTLRLTTVVAMLAAVFAAVLMVSAAAPTVEDGAAIYKTKCVACHGQKAEKKFDSSLANEQLIDIVMKGKKSEKPPNMPAYADKGVSADQAKALVEHMKQLKTQ